MPKSLLNKTIQTIDQKGTVKQIRVYIMTQNMYIFWVMCHLLPNCTPVSRFSGLQS